MTVDYRQTDHLPAVARIGFLISAVSALGSATSGMGDSRHAR